MDGFAAVAALADPVRRRLYRYVVAQPDAVGREQAAEGADVPLHTARFHLERLVGEGLLDVEFRRLSGRSGPGAGRPAKLYRRTTSEVSVQLPERSYDLVGSVLAAAVARSLAGEPIGSSLSDEARRRGHAAGASYDGAGAGLARAAGLLADEGYEPHLGERTLSMRNCPFDVLAREQPALVCGVNLDFVDGAIEGLGCPGLTARLDPGPERCCVRVDADV
jgi:predicted ArsR family transcriptional regulator